MSCLDVMYHQSYGAHYLPADAYKAAYYNHHHHHQQHHQHHQHHQQQQQQQQQQQRRPSAAAKMQSCLGQQQPGGSREQGPRRGPGAADPEPKDGGQPAGAEYLNSRCVLFTYFQGDIGDVVDEHFSRALSQSSHFGREGKPARTSPPPSACGAAGLWKDGAPEGQSGPAWSGSAYPSHPAACLPSVPVHADFSPRSISLNHADGALWAGHVLSQASLPNLVGLPDGWPYGLGSQGAGGYPSVHEVYHPHAHAHVHPRHPVFDSYPAHGAALESRFSPLLVPGVRSQSAASDGAKTEMDPGGGGGGGGGSPVSASPTAWTPSPLHASLEAYDSALDQTKAKSSVWF